MRMRTNGAMGDFASAVVPILPNPVVTPGQAAAMRASTGMGCAPCMALAGGGLSGLGIPGEVLWPELAYEQQQGRDVIYTVTGLAGVGDWIGADVASQPGIVGPLQGGVASQPGMRSAVGGGTNTNGLVNALAQARGMGIGAIATDSLTNFVSSVETGSSTLAGVTLPNWAWVGGAVLLAAMVAGKGGRR